MLRYCFAPARIRRPVMEPLRVAGPTGVAGPTACDRCPTALARVGELHGRARSRVRETPDFGTALPGRTRGRARRSYHGHTDSGGPLPASTAPSVYGDQSTRSSGGRITPQRVEKAQWGEERSGEGRDQARLGKSVVLHDVGLRLSVTLGPEVTERVLVGVVPPHLGDLSVPDPHHLAGGHIQPLVPATARGVLQRHPVLVVGQHVRELGSECPAAELAKLPEEASDAFPAAMVAGDRTSSGQVPRCAHTSAASTPRSPTSCG